MIRFTYNLQNILVLPSCRKDMFMTYFFIIKSCLEKFLNGYTKIHNFMLILKMLLTVTNCPQIKLNSKNLNRFDFLAILFCVNFFNGLIFHF